MSHAQQHPGTPQKQGLSVGVILAIVLGAVGLVLLAIVVALGAILLPAVSRAREAAMEARSMAQARGLAMAVDAYENANGAYPPVDTWTEDLIAGGLITDEQMQDYRTPSAERVYFFVPQDASATDPRAVLVYEHPDLFAGSGAVVYADGSAERIDEPRFSELITALTLPDGTPYAPHTAVALPQN